MHCKTEINRIINLPRNTSATLDNLLKRKEMKEKVNKKIN